MEMPGRTFVLSSAYRYGFNGQEDSDLGEGQTTAKFWEYDTRLGRRWNADPVFNTDISRYAAFGNNPLYFADPNGDFKTKFGAKLYQLFNGGEIKQAEYGDRKGEYYVHKKVDGGKGKKGNGSTLDEVVVAESVKWDWGKGSGGQVGRRLDEAKYFTEQRTRDLWNSPLARVIVPDYYNLSFSTTTTMGGVLGGYTTGSVNFYLVTRGKAPGIYYNGSAGAGVSIATGANISTDVGVSLNAGYYVEKGMSVSDFDPQATLGGEEVNVGAGVGAGIPVTADVVQINVGIGYTQGYNSIGKVNTIQAGFTISLSVAPPKQGEVKVQVGKGKASDAVPIWKF